MKFTSSYIGLSVALLSMLACKNNSRQEKGIIVQDTIPVKILALHLENSSAVVNTSGYFTTNDETLLSFKNGGVINRVFVKEGDRVSKGQLLATVNATETSTQVTQVNLAYQKAERDFKRATNLYRDSVATLEQMQNAKTALDLATQQMQNAKYNEDFTAIRATRNGFVLKKLANDGQVVGPGMPVLQINGAQDGNWILRAGVSDKQWAALKLGDYATVFSDALPGKELQAKVSRKAENVDPQSGTFNIELALLDKSTKGLAAGLFGKAKVFVSEKQTVFAIPYDALLDGGDNEGYVFVTDDNKVAKKVKVQLGAIQKDKITVTGGLSSTSAVIISGSAYLSDGAPIKVIK